MVEWMNEKSTMLSGQERSKERFGVRPWRVSGYYRFQFRRSMEGRLWLGSLYLLPLVMIPAQAEE